MLVFKNSIIEKLNNVDEIANNELNNILLESIQESGIFVKFGELNNILPAEKYKNIYGIVKDKVEEDYPLNQDLTSAEIDGIRQRGIQEYQMVVSKDVNGEFILQDAVQKSSGKLGTINSTNINTDNMKKFMISVAEDSEKRFQFSDLLEEEKTENKMFLKTVKDKLERKNNYKKIEKQDIFEIAKLQMKEDIEEVKDILKKEIWGD